MNNTHITIKALLTKAAESFHWGEFTAQDQQHLLRTMIPCTRAELITRNDTYVTEAVIQAFWEACERCQQGEPLAYVLGTQAFFEFELKVTPDVLIPRGDTEILIAAVSQHVLGEQRVFIDLGTGSGAIALALAHAKPTWHCVAMDNSNAALHIAKQNSQTLNISLPLFQGHWTQALAPHCADVLVANPPYLSANDPHLADRMLQAEPRAALVAADAGLADFIEIIADAKRVLCPQGYLFLEHGWQQHAVVADLLQDAGFNHVELVLDYAGHPRVTWGQF